MPRPILDEFLSVFDFEKSHKGDVTFLEAVSYGFRTMAWLEVAHAYCTERDMAYAHY